MWAEKTTHGQGMDGSCLAHPPINTVSAPGGMTAPPEAVRSATLAAGNPPIMTVVEPLTMASGPQVSLKRAAGKPPINTVGAPGGRMGVGAPSVAGLTIISVTRAAGNMSQSPCCCASVDLHDPALDHGGGAALNRRTGAGNLGTAGSR